MTKNDRKTRVAYVIEAGFEHFIALFMTGTMLGYILDALGLSDAMQGILSTAATFACSAQLFALIRTDQRSKRFVTLGNLINQICFVLVYLLPVFPLSPAVKTALSVALLILGHLISNAVSPAKTTWLMSAVPNRARGRFTAVKEMVSLAGGILVSLSFGWVADAFRSPDGTPTPTYYVICFLTLLLMTLIHTASLLVSHEKAPEAPHPPRQRPPIRKTLGRLVRNRPLVKVIGVGMLWNMASALSVSFFASYLREELAFSFTLIAWITTVGSVCRIAVSPILGRIADKYSFATSMTISFTAAAIGFLAVVFTAPETRWLYLIYACLNAFAMAGINSGVINLIYDYVPEKDRTIALGTKNALGGILGFFTVLFGGLILARIQAGGGLIVFGLSLYAQQLLALLSFLVTLLLLVYMRTVIAPLRRIPEEESPQPSP